MKAIAIATLGSLFLFASPLLAQDENAEIVVTGNRISRPPVAAERRPVIGLKRQADSAVRNVEIVSDSREQDMRKREVQAMLLAAIDRAKQEGFSLVTGQYEIVEVTRANWQDTFPGLVRKEDNEGEEDDDDDEDDENRVQSGFEDDGSTTTVRLRVKTKLEGSIDKAQQKISRFVKSIPATGRSVMEQKGGLQLTIINPEQYRDELYRRIATGAKHAASFYGVEYSVNVTGLDRDIAWEQVSNTEVFLYIPYYFAISK
jgi:hypothetical protein